MSIPSIRSQAAIQFDNGPAHTMGVPPTNKMSPVNTVRASGTWAITSPLVCAGPTSINSTTRPPTSTSRRPSKVRVGRRCSMPSKRKAPKNERNNSPTSPGAAFNAANMEGGTSDISRVADVEATISAPSTS
jgi:hypothetical protein